jgi:hypothetical protein
MPLNKDVFPLSLESRENKMKKDLKEKIVEILHETPIDQQGDAILQLVEEERQKWVEDLLKKMPKNPYPEPLGNPDLGYYDKDGEKRDTYNQALSEIKEIIKKEV